MEEARKYDVTRMPDVSENPYASPYYGLWYKEIPCGDTLRRYYLYTPESYFPQMRNLSIFLPEGMGAEEFLEKSPWAGISEKESVLLILLVPGEGGYADTESEEAYYRAAFNATFNDTENEFAAICSDSRYIMGAGKGADLALRIALKDPARYSGLALFGPAFIDAETLNAFGAKLLPDGRGKEAKGYYNWNCALPAFVSADPESSRDLTEYLKLINDTEEGFLQAQYSRVYFERHGIFNDNRTHKPVSRLLVRDAEDPLSDFTDEAVVLELWNQLFSRIIRFPEDPYGALRVHIRPKDLSVRMYEKFMPHAAFVSPVKRMFGLYVPASYDGSEALPLLVATHGFTATYEYFFKNTEFWRVAEDRGFIVAFTQATPNDGSRVGTPRWRSGALKKLPGFNRKDDLAMLDSEIAYFRWVVSQVEEDYNIDKTRVYCTGHSNGGQMTYCLSELMQDVFAASAEVGFVVGQYPDVASMPERDRFMPALNVECSDDRNTDPDDPESELYKELLWRQKENGMDVSAPRMTEIDTGRYTLRSFTNAQGFPLVGSIIYKNACHAYFPDISYLVWDSFLCNYSRDEDGTSRYRGQVILRDKSTAQEERQ